MASSSDSRGSRPERYVPSDEVRAAFPRVRATVDAARGKVLSVQMSKTDFMQLGRMYSTAGMPGYGGSLMRVVAHSPLFFLLKMLLDDPGFRVGVNAHEHFDLLSLPTMADPELDVLYVVNVPSDMVWAALAFAVGHWGKQYGVGVLRYASQMDEAEFVQFLGRFQYVETDERAILAARRDSPAAVNAVYDALLRSSALLAVVVKNQSQVETDVGKRKQDPNPADLPDAPSGPVDNEPPPYVPEDEQKPPKPELRQISNGEVADELCAFIAKRSERAPEPMHQNIEGFCQTVRRTMAEFEKNGLHVAEMDGYTQGKYLESGAAQAVAMAYTLGSAERNPFLLRLVDAFLLVDSGNVESCESVQEQKITDGQYDANCEGESESV